MLTDVFDFQSLPKKDRKLIRRIDRVVGNLTIESRIALLVYSIWQEKGDITDCAKRLNIDELTIERYLDEIKANEDLIDAYSKIVPPTEES